MGYKKGKSKKKSTQGSYIGIFQANEKQIKTMDVKIQGQEELLVAKKRTYDELVKENIFMEKEIDRVQKRKRYNTNKLREVNEELKSVKSTLLMRRGTLESKFKVKFSSCLAKRRQRLPSSSSLNHSAKVIRRKEMVSCAKVINGGSDVDMEPVFYGLLDTLGSQQSIKKLAGDFAVMQPSIVKGYKDKAIKEWVRTYNKSSENLDRSLNVYYSHCPAGKLKYMAMRRAGRGKYADNFLINLVPYRMLAKKIQEIPIGTVLDVSPKFTADISAEEVHGRYRPATEHLPWLAQFYLTVNKHRHDKLKTFPKYEDKKIDKDSFLFLIALGCDGAPICGTTLLVSFLNVGERLPSSQEAWTLFGVDAPETSPTVNAYVKFLFKEIDEIEQKVFEVDVDGEKVKVEFKLVELPNDQKMLCSLAGELGNTAQFFTTFANVRSPQHRDPKATFGLTDDNTWRPWKDEERTEAAAKVKAFKMDLNKKKLKKGTKRTKITEYIGKINSRQEFEPLVGKHIGKAKFEPLHMKNNCVKELFVKVLKIAIHHTAFSGETNFKDLSSDLLLVKFVHFLRKVMNCNALSKKLRTWFTESKGDCKQDFKYRFRGQESRAYLTHFPALISFLLPFVKGIWLEKLLRVHKQSVLLRHAISYSARITNVTQNELDHLKVVCRELHVSSCVFDTATTPSMWGCANVLPVHSQLTFDSYGFGLGCNTMEGREQKHQVIAKYQRQTLWKNRWEMTFRHEFIHLGYLRLNGFDRVKYTKRSANYVPSPSATDCQSCALSSTDGSCQLCDNSTMKVVEKDMSEFLQ